MIDTQINKKGPLLNKVKVYVEEPKINKKAQKEEFVTKMKVMISTGKVFGADRDARTNIISAILAADYTGITETEWKMEDNTIQTVTLDELKEANALALRLFGNIVGI